MVTREEIHQLEERLKLLAEKYKVSYPNGSRPIEDMVFCGLWKSCPACYSMPCMWVSTDVEGMMLDRIKHDRPVQCRMIITNIQDELLDWKAEKIRDSCEW